MDHRFIIKELMFNPLLKIRLSTFTILFFGISLIFLKFYEQTNLTAGQLALFSVNSFLFGYYFAPLLSAQKARVGQLNSVARQETMILLDILAQSHLLSEETRHKLKVKLAVYLNSVLHNSNVQADNPYYDELLHFTKESKVKKDDQAILDTIYNRVSATQGTRDNLNNLFRSKVYSHEWVVASVLFGITFYFSIQTKFGDSIFFMLILAILMTGLAMLMMIMVKFATLSHKEAKRMWQPMQELQIKHLDDIDPKEIAAEKARIDKAS